MGVALGIALGLAAGFVLWRGEALEVVRAREPLVARVTTQEISESAAEVRVLRERLAEEVRLREDLVWQLEAAALPADPEVALAAEPEAPKHPEGWLDEAGLVAAGFTPAEIEALRKAFDAIELERLAIRDRATREGWLGKPRFYKRMRGVNDRYRELREEYGDERYDWILFAGGRPNRVVIERVMIDSAAAEVGLEVGDVFLAYDGSKVFGAHELQKATTSGELGQTVAVDIRRDGEHIRLYPDRGPLGVGLRFDRAQPDPLY